MVEGSFDSLFKDKPSPLLSPPAPAAEPAAAKGPAGKSAAATSAAAKSAAAKAPAGKAPVGKGASDAIAGAKAGDATAAADKAPSKPDLDRVIQHSPDSARLILLGSSAMLSDQVIRLIGETFGTAYNKPTEFVQNMVEWSLEDQGLLGIRGREHFARTLTPLSRQVQTVWEYLNYAAALGGLALVWLFNRRRRRAAGVRHLRLLEQV
jgi:ABC-2 type transport system permease protein